MAKDGAIDGADGFQRRVDPRRPAMGTKSRSVSTSTTSGEREK